jgi:thiamine pyrophosphokinase
VVAADGGTDHALAAGLTPDLVVGDLDSASLAALSADLPIERHPVAKDATDLALALHAALRLGAARIVVVGGAGGRVDHFLGQLLLLAADDYASAQVDGYFDEATVHVIRERRRLEGQSGELISLFAVQGSAVGVVTDGLVYPLRGETLTPGSSRGVSNEFAAAEATVALDEGVLLAVRPGTERAGTGSS